MIKVCTSRIGYGDRSLLAGILRASSAAADGQDRPVISGVNLERRGTLIRCAGTDGRFLAAVHAWGAGIEIPDGQSVIIHPASFPRVADLYRRCRAEFAKVLSRRDPALGGAPLVVATVEVCGKPETNTWKQLLHIRVPAIDDGCTVRLTAGSYPTFAAVEAPVAYRPGFAAGSSFDAAYLIRAQRILGTRSMIPYHEALPAGTARKTFFRGDDGDYCLVMPITLPDGGDVWIFGQPPTATAP